MKEYDVIVIGTGASGTPAAYGCKNAGLKVAIIDSHPYGGTCALRGCDPKKVLVGFVNSVPNRTPIPFSTEQRFRS